MLLFSLFWRKNGKLKGEDEVTIARVFTGRLADALDAHPVITARRPGWINIPRVATQSTTADWSAAGNRANLTSCFQEHYLHGLPATARVSPGDRMRRSSFPGLSTIRGSNRDRARCSAGVIVKYVLLTSLT